MSQDMRQQATLGTRDRSNDDARETPAPGRMLLVLPVPLLRFGGATFFETQACNGLERWAEHFENLTVAAPCIPRALADLDRTLEWRNTAKLSCVDRVDFVPLPWGYGLHSFARSYHAVRTQLRAEIARSEYLQFAIGGLVGDWAAVAALEAISQDRRFALHTDRVEHRVILETAQAAPIVRRLKTELIARLMARYHAYLIRRCSLGLWHGLDCYESYAAWCSESHLIHDVHTSPKDNIEPSELEWKLECAAREPVLHVCYAGRLEAMKAPLDWVRAICKARGLGARVKATWFGDGTLRPAVERAISELGLQDVIDLPGNTGDRAALLAAIKRSHMMVFTHITPESPRCLVEALICGSPIVGYECKYASDLASKAGGGSFVPMRDWQSLGVRIAELAQNRALLCALVRDAASSGTHFNDVAVFRERSELIKRHAGRSTGVPLRPMAPLSA